MAAWGAGKGYGVPQGRMLQSSAFGAGPLAPGVIQGRGTPALIRPALQRSAPLQVIGGSDAAVAYMVTGTFYQVSQNHGRPVYRKEMKVGGLEILCYFWDARDGPTLHGWWFGPAIGGDTVWAHQPSDAMLPPLDGWKVPYHGSVDPAFTVTVLAAENKRPALEVPIGQPAQQRPRIVVETPPEDDLVGLVFAHLESSAPKAEATMAELRALAVSLEGEHGLSDEEVLKRCDEVLEAGKAAKAAQKAVKDLMPSESDKKMMREHRKSQLSALVAQIDSFVLETDLVLGKVRSLKQGKEGSEVS
eukprot:TRINITY_DN47345_c0_g1_i1.p1 TRINITY_DN47345_c0_g1~~TRINITY_DN47345_c0_g1_i1.p1  ORF type:complete len:317 (-),score=61.88 TRINITY_DN47345_c0_g1_i1:134-1042(-)